MAESVSVTDLECPLCNMLLFDPLTIGCGHTFCRSCLVRCLSNRALCPYCQSNCTIDPKTYPKTLLISNITQKLDPNLDGKGINENFEEPRDISERLGIYYSDSVLFPGQKATFYIFEQKYILLLNRAVSTNKHIAVVYKNGGNTTAVVAAIEHYEKSPTAGRARVQLRGLHKATLRRIFVEKNGFGLHVGDCREVAPAEPAAPLSYQSRGRLLALELAVKTFAKRNTGAWPKGIPAQMEKLPEWVFAEIIGKCTLNSEEVQKMAFKCLKSKNLLEKIELATSALASAEERERITKRFNSVTVIIVLLVGVLYIFKSAKTRKSVESSDN